MSIVTFTSDFGTSDHYVAAVKATLLSAKPDIQVVDISHDIAPFDIPHMAYTLRSVYHRFPSGTIHLIAANGNDRKKHKDEDKKLDKERDALLLSKINGYFFIAPNNGIISLLSDSPLGGVYQWLEVPLSNFPSLKAAELAVELARGKSLENLGSLTRSYAQLALRQPKMTKTEIAGHVIRVDHYGNLVTNIKKQDFDILSKGRFYSLHFGREQSHTVHQSIREVESGEAFFIFNTEGLLLIGINQGHASQLLGLHFDSPVYIQFQDAG